MDCLKHLTDDLEEVETKVEAIFKYVTDDPPEIVIENLSLVKSLLTNCRSHIQIRTDELNLLEPKDNICENRLNIDKVISSTDLKVEVFENKNDWSTEDVTDPVTRTKIIKEEVPENEKKVLSKTELENIDTFDQEESILSDIQPVLIGDREYYYCEICKSKFINLSNFVDHQTNFDHEELKCTFCSKYFRTHYHLKHHVQKHTKVKLFCCDICGKQLTTKEYVAWHKEIIHGVGKKKSEPQECEKCGKVFSHERYLNNHIKFVHTLGKNYACDKCGSTFKKKQYLVRHLNIHIEDKPFSCDECVKPRAFKTMSDLEEHKVTHSSIKPFQCELCPSQTSRQRSLKEHYRRKHKIDKIFSSKTVEIITQEKVN